MRSTNNNNKIFIYSALLVVSSPLLSIDVVQSFFLPSSPLIIVGSRPSSSTTTTTLAARKAGKTSKRKNNSSAIRGGFGGSSATAVSKKNNKKSKKPGDDNDDDYAVFPKLEPNVLETLVPAPSHETEPGELPNEIYSRLEQIYGLPHFNYYETIAETEQESYSSTTTSSTDSLTDMLGVSSTISDDDVSSPLDNLLLSTTTTITGTDTDKTASEQQQQSSSFDKLSLDELPPFDKLRVLHVDPLVLSIDNFFTDAECDAYVAACSGGESDSDDSSDKKNKKNKNKSSKIMQSRSPTVGKDAAAKAQRTSTTWYHHYKDVPQFMARASRLLGLDTIQNWEEPQTVRYRRNEKFTWHLDALGPAENQPNLGGQRTATLLVYHTTLDDNEGGATIFRDLGDDSTPLKMQPKKGSALLFFPAAGGIPDTPFDIRTLHCGEVVSNDSKSDKWISQLWLRHSPYKPTAPPGNDHLEATNAISEYCKTHSK